MTFPEAPVYASAPGYGTVIAAVNAARRAAAKDDQGVTHAAQAAAGGARRAAERYPVDVAVLVQRESTADEQIRQARIRAAAVPTGICSDLDLLCQIAKKECWTDNSPVDPQALGELPTDSDFEPSESVQRQLHLEEWTRVTIDAAYSSYCVAVSDTLFRLLDHDADEHLRELLTRLVEGYEFRLSIDKRQIVNPVFERVDRAILKACQYAQAALVQDLSAHYSTIARIPRLKSRASLMIRLSPRDIQLELQPPGIDLPRLGISYRSIEDPGSAARIIGQLNSTDDFTRNVAYWNITDELLDQRINEAESAREGIQFQD